MKTEVYMKITIIFIFLLSFTLCAQDKERYHKKLEELEQVKLLEKLQLEEETAVRFFSKRSGHKNEMRKLYKEAEKKLKEIKSSLESENLSDKVDEYFQLEQEMFEARENYYSSLKDILSEKQIAEVILFEKNFKDEIRKLLMKEKKFKKRK